MDDVDVPHLPHGIDHDSKSNDALEMAAARCLSQYVGAVLRMSSGVKAKMRLRRRVRHR
jgi:hypothetical protein